MLVTQSRRSGDGNPGLIIRTSAVAAGGKARMEETEVRKAKATNANFMVVSSI